MSNSLIFNGVDFGGAGYGLVVTGNTFVQPPQPRINRDALASADGDIAQGATFEALTGDVTGIVLATSYANLITARNNIAAALQTGQEGVKALSFDAWTGKSWMARPYSVKWGEESTVTIELTITFYAPDPWALATTPTTSDGSNSGTGTTTI